jgi:hypothetical protein
MPEIPRQDFTFSTAAAAMCSASGAVFSGTAPGAIKTYRFKQVRDVIVRYKLADDA